MGRSREQRVAEYVDSPLLSKRVRIGEHLSCHIHGSLGTYRVYANTDTKTGACTCPSEEEPCKHVAALLETWKCKPHSFPDIDDLLATALRGKTKAELVDTIRGMILEAPSCLTALGLLGYRDYFVADEEDDW